MFSTFGLGLYVISNVPIVLQLPAVLNPENPFVVAVSLVRGFERICLNWGTCSTSWTSSIFFHRQ